MINERYSWKNINCFVVFAFRCNEIGFNPGFISDDMICDGFADCYGMIDETYCLKYRITLHFQLAKFNVMPYARVQ